MTVQDANTYFSTRWASEAWSELTDVQKQAALTTATNQLAPFSEAAQYTTAIYEQALFLVESSPETQAQIKGATKVKWDELSLTFDLGDRPAHIAPLAWYYLHSGKNTITAIKCGRVL